MDLGSEISQKFKSSIKKKLKESGTYIDDELPEYIMVMIANKRNEYQMKDDLSLFLGDETEQFVAWLFAMLRRLQSAAQVDNIANAEAKSSGVAEENRSRKMSGSIEVELLNDQVLKTEVKEKQVEINQPSPAAPGKEAAVAAPWKEAAPAAPGKEITTAAPGKEAAPVAPWKEAAPAAPQKDISPGPPGKDASSRENMTEKVLDTEEHFTSKEKKQKKRHHSRGDSPSKKRAGSDDDNRASSVHNKPSVRKTSTSGSSSKRIKSTSEEEKEEENEEKTQQPLSQIHLQKVRPSLPSSRQASGLLIRRAMQEANRSVTTQPRVQSEEQHGNETYDGLAEISIEVKNDTKRVHLKREKKHKINSSLATPSEDHQQETAGNDLIEDEAEGKRPRLGEPEKTQDDGIEVEVPENEFLEEEAETKNRPDKRIVISGIADISNDLRSRMRNEGRAEENAVEALKDGESVLNTDDQGKTERNDSEVTREDRNALDDRDDKQRRDRRRHRHRRERHGHRDRRQNSPRFVVTLHGALEEQKSHDRQRRRPVRQGYSSSDEDPLFVDLNPKAPMEMLESAQQEINKMAHRLDMMQNVLPAAGLEQYAGYAPANTSTVAVLPSTIPSLPTLISKPLFSDSLPVVAGRFNSGNIAANPFLPPHGLTGGIPFPPPVIVMQKSSNVNRSSSSLAGQQVVVPVDTEAERQLSEEENVEPVEEDADENVLERCKFWPNCTNNSCQYIHPNKPCRSFPNCSFKDQCIFIHPMCKFDKLCNKSTCSFTHTKKQRQPVSNFAQSALSMDTKIPICHFYPNCSKSNCPYRHPPSKACRFGSACNRPKCPFHHETRPAIGDALKWSANPKNSPTHISDRSFASSQDEVSRAPVAISTL